MFQIYEWKAIQTEKQHANSFYVISDRFAIKSADYIGLRIIGILNPINQFENIFTLF